MLESKARAANTSLDPLCNRLPMKKCHTNKYLKRRVREKINKREREKRIRLIRQVNYEKLRQREEAARQLEGARLRHIVALQRILMRRMLQLDPVLGGNLIRFRRFEQLTATILKMIRCY